MKDSNKNSLLLELPKGWIIRLVRHGEGPEGMDMRKLCFDGGGGLMEERRGRHCWSFSYFLKKSPLGGETKCGEQWRNRRAIWRQRIKQGEVIPNTELGEGCWSKCHLLAKFANIDPIFENSRLVTLRLIKCPFTQYLPLWTGCGKRIVHEFNLQRFFFSLFLVLK